MTPRQRRLAVALAVWAAGYAAYRLYYGFGGHVWRRSAVVGWVLAGGVAILSGLGAIPTFRSG